jgi:hypothetical protein
MNWSIWLAVVSLSGLISAKAAENLLAVVYKLSVEKPQETPDLTGDSAG